MAAGDAEHEAVTDLSCCPCDGDTYGFAHGLISSLVGVDEGRSRGRSLGGSGARGAQVLLDRAEELLGRLPGLLGAHEDG